MQISDDQCIKVINALTTNECIGCAIIKNIDFDRQCFELLSPESAQTIAAVNCIVRPNGVSVPADILLDQMHYTFTSNLSYISSGT